MRAWSNLILVILLVAGTAASARAQDTPLPAEGEAGQLEMVDRVAAVVGDSVILYSEVLEGLQQRRAELEAAGQPVPTEPDELEALEEELLEGLIESQLLLQAAQADTLVSVTDDMVDREFEPEWQQRVDQLGGEANLRQALTQQGLSLADFRSTLREQLRRNLLVEQFLELRRQEAGPVTVDESEVEEYFERERATFPERAATIRFHQALIEPQPADESMAEARAEAERILGLMQEGEDFAELAERFSDDTGSAEQGGELGWFRRGSDLVAEFEEAAFQLREGQTSGPVETSLGVHIIRVDRVRGAERRIRHILVRAEGDQEAARARAEAIAEDVRSGTPLSEIIDGFDESDEQSGLIQLQMDELDQFPTSYADALRSAEPDELIGPVELELDEMGDRSAWAVLEIVEIREAGEYELEDMRVPIRNFLQTDKFRSRLMDRLRSRTHIEIRI